MNHDEIFDNNPTSDFIFVDQHGEVLWANKFYLYKLEFFRTYFNSQIGDSVKSEYKCDSIKIIRPIIRFLSCMVETPKFKKEIKFLELLEIIEFCKHINMWGIKEMYDCIYWIVKQNITDFCKTYPSQLPLILNLIRDCNIKSEITNILNKFDTMPGTYEYLIHDDEIMKYILINAKISHSLEIIKNCKYYKGLNWVLDLDDRILKKIITDYSKFFYNMYDEERNFIIPYSVIYNISHNDCLVGIHEGKSSKYSFKRYGSPGRGQYNYIFMRIYPFKYICAKDTGSIYQTKDQSLCLDETKIRLGDELILYNFRKHKIMKRYKVHTIIDVKTNRKVIRTVPHKVYKINPGEIDEEIDPETYGIYKIKEEY